MTNPVERIANRLKEIIDKNGLNYLMDEPYETYMLLVESKTADRRTAGAILQLLVSGLLQKVFSESDYETLSRSIQKECSLNKKMADRLAAILLSLYSGENKERWKTRDLEGLNQFLSEEFSCTWKGFAVWDAGNGTVDCHYEAKIKLAPTKAISEDAKLAELIRKNPFMKKEDVRDHFEKRLRAELDYEFEEYCTEDDYYQPVVEDFGGNLEYCLEEWCKENGFEFASCEGDGDDDGYEPKFRKDWY